MNIKPAKCRSCGADIGWVNTLKGKAMPVDLKPQKVLVQDLPNGGHYTHWYVCDGYTSHFATCPNADQHRKDKS